jgi:hypothetical protein
MQHMNELYGRIECMHWIFEEVLNLTQMKIVNKRVHVKMIFESTTFFSKQTKRAHLSLGCITFV